MIALQQVHKFVRKSPEQRRVTARFFATKWLATLPYAPHRVRLRMSPSEDVSFWWSCFPGAVGPTAESIFAYWAEDSGDLRLLWRLLKPGMTFFDVGAYHGIYTVIAAKKLGQSGSVIVFEPSPREQRRLRLHLRLNRVGSVDIVPCAVGSDEAQVTFATVLSGNTMRNGLRPPLSSDRVETVIVPKTTLDKYLGRTRIHALDLIKIDTEGAELEVFQGAQRLLAHLRPLVICEVLDQSTRPWGYPAREIITQLESYDYRWFDILQDGSVLPHALQHEYPDVRNYLAVPRERQDRFQ